MEVIRHSNKIYWGPLSYQFKCDGQCSCDSDCGCDGQCLCDNDCSYDGENGPFDTCTGSITH